jgi:hypothetical protein
MQYIDMSKDDQTVHNMKKTSGKHFLAMIKCLDIKQAALVRPSKSQSKEDQGDSPRLTQRTGVKLPTQNARNLCVLPVPSSPM